MPVFSYQALDGTGRRVEGRVEAGSRNEAFDRLARQRLQPLNLDETHAATAATASASHHTTSAPAKSAERGPVGPVRLSRRQLLDFTEEMADLLDSGMQLEGALGVLATQKGGSPLVPLARQVRELLREGQSFSSALRRTSRSFDELYLNMVQAGEQSGALGKILRRQQQQLLMMEDLKSRVRGALIYPAFMIFAAAVLMLVFMTYLVPQMKSLFGSGGAGMPLVTRVLIGFSEGVLHYWWLGAIIIAALITGAKMALRTPGGAAFWDEQKLRLPRVGRVVANGIFAQIAQTLAVLLQNGVPLLGSLRLVQAATPNARLNHALALARDRVADGASLSQALGRTDVFPPEFLNLVVLGEQTGDLPKALEKAAARFDKELNKSISALTAMIQPVIIIIMALLVGLIAFSMMSGIFQAVNALRPS